MIGVIIRVIDLIAKAISLIVIIHIILSYFMSPYHPVRITLSRIVEPMLSPLRRIIPAIAGIDFSPFILLLLIQLIESLLVSFLRNL